MSILLILRNIILQCVAGVLNFVGRLCEARVILIFVLCREEDFRRVAFFLEGGGFLPAEASVATTCGGAGEAIRGRSWVIVHWREANRQRGDGGVPLEARGELKCAGFRRSIIPPPHQFQSSLSFNVCRFEIFHGTWAFVVAAAFGS